MIVFLISFFFGGLSASLFWFFLLLHRKQIYLSEQNMLKLSINSLKEKISNNEEFTSLMEKTFTTLSQKALKNNHDLFLNMARGNFEKILAQIDGKWTQKEEKFHNIALPIKEMLQRLEKQRTQMENTHQKTHGHLEEQLRFLMESNHQLKKETANLVSALRKPQVRGKWGEITLKRVVEIAGMTDHCDFFEQTHLSNEDGTFRPDMIIHLPQNRHIIIDAKVPLQAYLDTLEMETEEEKKTYLSNHTRQVIEHMDKLSAKNYWNQFKNTPDFVVMFMPAESFFSTAMAFEKNLIERGLRKKILIATPTTLIALLQSIAYGWRQNQLTDNAEKIKDLAQELYDRISRFLEHQEKIRRSLKITTDSFNSSLYVLEKRVLVSARKLKDMGVQSSQTLDTPETLEDPNLIKMNAKMNPFDTSKISNQHDETDKDN